MNAQHELRPGQHREAQRIVIAVVAADLDERKITGGLRSFDPVHRIVLIGEQRIEERLGVEQLMDVGERQMMMLQECGLLPLQALHERRHRFRWRHPRPYGRGRDHQPEHAFNARHRRMPARAHHPIDNVVAAGQTRQQHRPRRLQHSGQRETERARQLLERGCQVGR
jgi:hypothetical protein